MDQGRRGGLIHKPDRQQHKEILTQRKLRKQPVACFFFLLLLAGLISNLIHGDVKPQLRLHLRSCLATVLCLLSGAPFEKKTEQRIIDNVPNPLPLLACKASDTGLSGDQRGGHTVHDSSHSDRCRSNRAHGWKCIQSQAVRNCLRDKIIKCAVHVAHICFEPIYFSAVVGRTLFSKRTSHVMQCSDCVKMKCA